MHTDAQTCLGMLRQRQAAACLRMLFTCTAISPH